MTVEIVLREASMQFDRRYRYFWPRTLGPARLGLRVSVPFGKANKLREAYVCTLISDSDDDDNFDLKEVSALLYPEPVLLPEQLQLAEMMRLRYACTYGEAIRSMLPPGFNIKTNLGDKVERSISIANPVEVISLLESGQLKTVKQQRVLEMLLEYGESSVTEVKESAQISEAVLKRLAEKGLLIYGTRKISETYEIENQQTEAEAELEPTLEQAAVLNTLADALLNKPESDRRRLKEYLLHGVTGSGKTEIYLQLSKEVIKSGRSCLILVPEIALTPQMIERFTKRFGKDIAVMHSRLSQRERFEQWKRIISGQVKLLVGVRSAVFMPLQDLALIIMDEEHESSYQSEMNPRYHARTIARLRARDRDCLLLLGSATPAVETYARCSTDKTKLLELKFRPGGAVLPKTEIVDMRKELNEGHSAILSRPLLSALEACFRQGEQAMLFINRRGYSGLYLCRNCGYKASCPSCSVALTYHKQRYGQKALLQCHYCAYSEPAEEVCPVCKEARIQAYGLGTQQVESTMKTLFPGRQFLRMDQDTTYSKYAYRDILDAFRRGEADVLIGTQMIAKGHDIPNVTVVGVLACDQLLNGNDYRVNERGFQLITQAAGRAGRGSLPGQVILQSFDPTQDSLVAAMQQDYHAFYKQEIAFRKALNYPPFASIARIIVACVDNKSARMHSEYLEKIVNEAIQEQLNLQSVKVFGTQLAYPARLFGKTRYQILLKSQDEAALSYLLRLLRQVRSSPQIAVSLSLDPA